MIRASIIFAKIFQVSYFQSFKSSPSLTILVHFWQILFDVVFFPVLPKSYFWFS